MNERKRRFSPGMGVAGCRAVLCFLRMARETAGGGVLKFRTNLNGAASFNVRVLAFVQGPLEVKPGGFLTLGLIRKGNASSKRITFEPNDGIDLHATSLEFEKASLAKEFLSAKQFKDGSKLIVELSVAAISENGGFVDFTHP